MVRLRIAARIFSEDDYLKNSRAGKTIAAPVEGEKRLVVVVRDPYQWQIGTLLLEIQRTYKSCYQRDLPAVKKLKDADDCDIAPESYVSDTLLDEGRAQTDPSDQRVTVNVVVEHGRSVREGSIAVGSQLENPRYQTQLERASRPPVPTFPELPSSLGKRPFALADHQSSLAVEAKRARHTEIPETQGEEQELLSSIEHDEPLDSIELVKGTQYSNPEQERSGQSSLVKPKDDSPILRKLAQKVPSEVIDQIEEFPKQSPESVSIKQGKKGSSNTQSSPVLGKPNGVSPTTAGPQEPSQAPITPPSETARRRSECSTLKRRQPKDAAKSPARLLSASASKFKRQDVYDYAESEIDDSQMSPRSKIGHLSHRKSNDRLYRIESLQSPQHERGEDEGLSISQAIDTLDDESVFDDEIPVAQSFRTPEDISRKASSGSINASEISIYEDAETKDAADWAQREDTTTNHAESAPVAKNLQVNGDIAEASPKPVASQSGQDPAKVKSPGGKAPKPKFGTLTNKRANSVRGDEGIEPKSTKRRRKSHSTSISVDGDTHSNINDSENGHDHPETMGGEMLPPQDTKSAKKSKASKPTLDSPGEQLSQDLRESTTKLPMKALNKKLADAQKTPKSSTPAKKGEQAVKGDVLAQAKQKPPNGVSLKSTASTKNNVRKQATTGPPSSPPPSIVVQRAEQTVGSSPALSKPLRNWGSDVLAATGKQQAVARGRGKENLNVDEQDDLRKSPSAGLGLTTEEIKIMESRKNMTMEEYAAEKKRKQQESKKKAEEQKKQDAAAKKTPAIDKTRNSREVSVEKLKSSSSSVIPQTDADGKLQCPNCQMAYSAAEHLKKHMLSHTGERPYRCVLCNNTFSRPDLLKKHLQKCGIGRGNSTGASDLSNSAVHIKKNQQKQATAYAASTTSPPASTEDELRKSHPPDVDSEASLERTSTQTSTTSSDSTESEQSTADSSSGRAKSVSRESSGLESSSKGAVAHSETSKKTHTPAKASNKRQSVPPGSTASKASNVETLLPPKTPAKAAKKSPFLKSVPSGQTPKPSTQQEKGAKTPNTTAKKSTIAPASQAKLRVALKTPSTTSQPARPYEQRMADLRATIRNADKIAEAPKGNLLSRINQTRMISGFEVEDDDDDSEEEDEDEASDSSDEEQYPKAAKAAKAAIKAAGSRTKTKTTVQSKQETSEDSQDEDEESPEDEKTKKSSTGRVPPPSTKRKARPLGRPDPTIRDRSVDSDEDDGED